MTAVFREVRRVLRDDGTLWLNMGDSYNAGRDGGHAGGKKGVSKPENAPNKSGVNAPGLKPKDLCGMPWRLALALQADGWWLRRDIIWSKLNPMPESCTDRPTTAHEYIFLMTKAPKYYYDADAVREPQETADRSLFYDIDAPKGKTPTWGIDGSQSLKNKGRAPRLLNPAGRNKRSVWPIATQAYPEAHFATFPEKLVEPCILAGSKVGDMVFDPFTGSGTVAVMAKRFLRNFTGLELNPEYIKMANRRIRKENPQLPFEVE